MKTGSLNMTLKVSLGRGYETASSRETFAGTEEKNDDWRLAH